MAYIEQPFTIGFMKTGATLALNSWIGDSAHDTLEQAQARMSELGNRKGILAAAIFPSHAWNLGCPTCKPRFLIDNTDYSKAPIKNLDGLINSLESDWF